MKNIFTALGLFVGLVTFAQSAPQTADTDLMTWYHKDFSSTNVYGVNTQNAYKYLEAKGLKPKPVIVGVIDSGIQIDHPGLAKNIWTNVNEVPGNGKDDDNNGFVDDVHGWNFLGNKNGDLYDDNMEVTRMVKKYKPIFEGPDSASNKANQAKMPEEFAMYMKSKEIFTRKSIEARQAYETYRRIQQLVPTIVEMLQGRALSQEVVSSIRPTTQEQAVSLAVLSQLLQDPEMRGKKPEELRTLLTEQMNEAVQEYETQATKHYNLDFDPRAELVGDNYDDYSEHNYGNNHYNDPKGEHGTHVAGIIAGVPNGNEVQYGVGYKTAKIMTLRAVPNGDERDKDIANAIRYAVANGAKIINMSFGKPISPGKEEVWKAFKFAEDNGVLLVKAAGNENENIAENVYYPTNFKDVKDERAFLNNMIVVGASTNNNEFLRADFSNYNGNMVDVFAPGDKIYSTVPGSKYKYLQGTSMASPVVAGAASVLLAYMPNLTPPQIIEALVNTANKSSVNAMINSNTNNRFDLISRSGGVIDLRKAAEYAYTHFYRAPEVRVVKPVKKSRPVGKVRARK